MILEISCFLYFPNGNWPPCWIFKTIKFYMLTRLVGTRHITMSNFFINWSTCKAEILQFFNFPNGRRHHLLFLKSQNRLANGVQRIKTYEHVKCWQNRSIGYVDIKIFKIFTTRRLAKRGICRRRVSVCLSVCLCVCVCVCPSHSGIVSKRLNVGSRK